MGCLRSDTALQFDKEDDPMNTGSIPGLSRSVSRLFFGTAIPPVSTDGAAAPDLLDSVLAAGVNAFDCARSYGLAENVLGKWIESRGCRDRVVILTKCGDIRDGIVKVDRQVILEPSAQSLESLRTDSIDLYLLHRDDPETPLEEIIDTLNELRESGKIKLFGVSNWTHHRIEAANRSAASHGLAPFSVSSPNYGLALQMRDLWGGGCVTLTGPENSEARAWYTSSQMPVISYSGMARGFFSGRFKAGDYEGAKQILDAFAQKGYLYQENMLRLRKAELLAEKYGCSVPEINIRYIFSSGMNLFAIVSTTSADRLKMDLRAASESLSPEDVDFLESDAPASL